jgi:aspartyl/glutamyl-tRNA(Asn/Gln) amidotransferase C subunit
MRLTDSELEKLSKLAKLNLEESDKVVFKDKIQRIIDFVDLIEKANIESAELDRDFCGGDTMMMRIDNTEDAETLSRALAEAPSVSGTTFKVPRFHD